MPEEREPRAGLPELKIYDPEPADPARSRRRQSQRPRRRRRTVWDRVRTALRPHRPRLPSLLHARRLTRHRLVVQLRQIDWRDWLLGWSFALAIVAVACLIPLSFYLLRAWVDGDAVVVDRRAGLVAPGPAVGAVPGGAVTVSVPAEGVALPPGAREARVQVRSTGFSRSQQLMIGGPRGPSDLRWVQPEDGTCFDLGPLPRAGTTAVYRVLPLGRAERWGLTPAAPLSGDFADVRAGGATLDYRIVAHVPVGPGEALARLTFFVRMSRFALLALGAALAAMTAAVRWWLDGHRAAAAAALATGMTALFVAVVPPFQAADESTHAGSLEYVIAGASRGRWHYWPASMAMVTNAIDLERVRYQPESALPLLSPAERRAVSRVLGMRATGEARLAAWRSRAETQSQDEAPLFYPLGLAIPQRYLKLQLRDRVFLYRGVVVGAGVALALAGLGALALAGVRAEVLAGCLAIFLIPQWLGVVGSTTPYSPGLGAVALASCLIVGSTGLRRWTAFVWLLSAAAVAVAGGLLVRESYLLALLAGALAMWRVARPSSAGAGGEAGSRWLKALLVLAVVGGVAAAAAGLVLVERGLPANLRAVAAIFERRRVLTDVLPRWLPLIVSPLAAAAALIFAERWAGRRGDARARRWLAFAPAVAIVLLLVVSQLVFPDARVPTSARVEGMTAELYIRRIFKAIAVTALSFDQDFIAWKSFFGALGWQDVVLPPVVYALARWFLVALFLAVPYLYVRAAGRRPREARRMLVLAAAGTTMMLLMMVTRAAAVILHGRYLLFLGPLLGMALASLAGSNRGRKPLLAIVAALVALDLFIALYFVPCRYFLEGGGIDWARLP